MAASETFQSRRSQLFATSQITFFGFQLYLFTFMFYVFDSGGIQPSHGLFMLIFLLALPSLDQSAWAWKPYVRWLFAFWFYAVFVNLANAIFFHDSRLLLAPMYFMFNGLVFVLTIHLFLRNYDQLMFFLGWTCLLALLVQLMFLIAGFGLAPRSEGTFNNPNQLGYWALMIATLYGVVYRTEPLRPMDLAVTILALICAVYSLSKAAMVAIAVTLVLILLQKLSLRRFLNTMVAIPLSLALVYLFFSSVLTDIFADLFDLAAHRISSIGQDNDDNAAGRNYDRIWRWPEYLIFGAGEGGYYRFTDGTKNNEIHSSLGTLLFSYGIIGSALFFIFLFSFALRAGLAPFMFFAPLFLYGITHQGLRSSLFWVFLGILSVIATQRKRSRFKSPSNLVDVVK